jgi:hypothetical protein
MPRKPGIDVSGCITLFAVGKRRKVFWADFDRKDFISRSGLLLVLKVHHFFLYVWMYKKKFNSEGFRNF